MADDVKMVRLRNVNSGAVVQVPEGKVEGLGAEWEPATKATTKAASSKSS